jgi:hypothetical protein
VRGELRLAKAELAEKGQRAGRAGGYLGLAAVCGLLAGACATTACIAALALVMPVWLAGTIMFVILVCISAAAYYGGREKLRAIDPVPRNTVETVKENLQWAKQRTT